MEGLRSKNIIYEVHKIPKDTYLYYHIHGKSKSLCIHKIVISHKLLLHLKDQCDI